MCEEDNKANRTRQFARDLLSFETNYYNHKETRAHACLVLQMAIFAQMMTEDGWAIIRNINLFLFIILWSIPYLYVRWELRKRRFSAIRVCAIERALGKWVTKKPVVEELKSPGTTYRPYRFWKGLDYIFPFPLFCLKWLFPVFFKWLFPPNYMMNSILPENKADKYPAPLSKAIQDVAKEKDFNSYFLEYLVSIPSFLIWFIVFYRRLTYC